MKGLPSRRPFTFTKNRGLRRFNHLARLEAGGANAHAFVRAVDARAHRPQVHVPAAAAHVVGVADLVSKLRAFAADVANLCHLIDSRIFNSEEAGKRSEHCS